MTLSDLIGKVTDIQNQFNSSSIKIYHGDQEVWFDLDVMPPRGIAEPWKIKIINYREGEK